MDMLSYLLGKNNNSSNKRYDYIIDARGIIGVGATDKQITDAGLLAQLNKIVEDGVYDNNHTLKQLKIGLYIDNHFVMENPNIYNDNVFLESIGLEDSTEYDSDETIDNGYLRYSIHFFSNVYQAMKTYALKVQVNPDQENVWWLLVETIE